MEKMEWSEKMKECINREENDTRYCRVCGQLTFPEGFYPSRIARYDWICKSCTADKVKEFNKTKEYKGKDKYKKHNQPKYKGEQLTLPGMK